jgi:hypothetical protein
MNDSAKSSDKLSEKLPRAAAQASQTQLPATSSPQSGPVSASTAAAAAAAATAASSAAPGTPGDDEDLVTIKAAPSDERYANETVYVQVSRADAAYNLQPIHCGRSVVFLNAQDPRFYKRELPKPSLNVWVLSQLGVHESHALKRIYESGWRQNIQVKILQVDKFELVATKEGLENVLYEGTRVDLPDAIFVRVGANVGYFGLAVIRQLEQLGVLMFNTLRSIEISRDKMLQMQHLAAHGLPIPKTILAKFPIDLQLIQREFQYPIIIKRGESALAPARRAPHTLIGICSTSAFCVSLAGLRVRLLCG